MKSAVVILTIICISIIGSAGTFTASSYFTADKNRPYGTCADGIRRDGRNPYSQCDGTGYCTPREKTAAAVAAGNKINSLRYGL